MAAIVKRRPLPAAWLPINVKDYGATGNGTTSDQVAVALAVARAYAAGAECYWPPGTYLTTANIANLHDVRHFGPGIIKRGSALFYVEPRGSQTNTLYVSASGSTTNDGITSSEPMTLLRSAAVVLAYAERGLPGRWVVEGAAGTYASGQKFNLDSLTWADYPITLRGPDVSGHPNTPTMIIDMTGDESGKGVSISEGGWLTVEDVKVIDATTGTGFSVSRARLDLTNCHTDNCYYGVNAQHGAYIGIFGGDFDGNSISGSHGVVTLYNCTHNITAGSTADAALFHDCNYGVVINEGGQGHLDYTRIHDCTIAGFRPIRGSGACNTLNMQIYRNAVGVLAEVPWFNNGIDFGTGSDANTVNVRTNGSAAEFDYRNQDFSSKTMRLQQILSDVTHTGTASATDIYTVTDLIRTWMISEGGHVMHFNTGGTCTLTGSAAVLVTLNNGSDDFLAQVTIPSDATRWELNVKIYFNAASGQRCLVRLSHNSTTVFNKVDYGTGALALKNTAATLKIACDLVNSGDTVVFVFGEVWTTFGG